MKKAIVLAACLAVMFAPTARAAGTDDPDDTAGRLDIKYLGAHIVSDRLEFEVSMYRQWPNRLVREDRGSVNLLFNTRGDGAADLILAAERRMGRWIGRLCPAKGGGGGEIVRACQKAKVWRSEAESIEFSVARDQILKDGADSYVWRAKTKLRFAEGCPDTGSHYCIDRAVGKQAD
jgi:hypothetical protein